MVKKLKKVIACVLVFAIVNSFSFDSVNTIIAKMLDEKHENALIQQMLKENLSEYLYKTISTKNVKLIKENTNNDSNNVLELEMEDGSTTAYSFSEDVKFAVNGQVKYKEVSIVPQQDTKLLEDGYTYTNGENNYRINFSEDINKGVFVEGNDYKLSYIPIPNDKNASYKGSQKKVEIDNNIVDAFDYADIFGKDSILRYTPQLNSVQKDIILNK